MESRTISLQEGALLAGVTPETIEEYARFGFLNPVDQGGKTQYKEIEIQRLFGVNKNRPKEFEDEPSEEDSTSVDEPFTADPINTGSSEASLNAQIESSGFTTRATVVTPPHNDNGYELVALNRQLKEEIKQLREERDWLRSRLERLEERSERDQMLILSESQTVRSLVNQGERKSFWARLPFFGD